MNEFGRSFLVTLLILVIVTVAFIFFGMQMSSKISTNTQDIGTLTSQISSVTSSLSAADSSIATLQAQVSTDMSALQTQLSSINSQITTLQGQLSSLTSKGNNDVSTLQTQLSSINSQMATLQNKLNATDSSISALQNQVTSFSSQISSLQDEISTINTEFQTPVQVATSLTISQAHGQESLVKQFYAETAGHVYINGYSTSPSGYVYIVNSNGTSTGEYDFSTSDVTVIIPVQPGTNYIFFGNSDSSGTIGAVFEGIVYYHY